MIKKKITKFLLKSRRRPFLVKKNKLFIKIKNSAKYHIQNFGNKNPNKIFYVIKRFRGGGLFSNLLYVLNHLIYADKLNAIPIVDMENFTNFYSEKNKIKGTKNSWLYYFEQVSKYNLKAIYKSKFVILSDDKPDSNMSLSYKQNEKALYKVFKKYIKVKKEYLKEANKFIKENFKNKKILGVHWRGTDHKVLPNHPFPPTKKQILTLVEKVLNKHKFKKIFLITEEKNYLEVFKKKFKSKVCYFNSFRSDSRRDFAANERKNHNYKLGYDSLIEVLILSKVNMLVCSRSNIAEAAVFFSNKKYYKVHEIFNGFNSKSILFSLFLWHVKKILPRFLGGFK